MKLNEGRVSAVDGRTAAFRPFGALKSYQLRWHCRRAPGRVGMSNSVTCRVKRAELSKCWFDEGTVIMCCK